MGHIPTDEQILAGELWQMYRRGWTDGASGRIKDPKNMTHPTRPDLPAMYLRGFEDGSTARHEALQRVGLEVGVDTDPTR